MNPIIPLLKMDKNMKLLSLGLIVSIGLNIYALYRIGQLQNEMPEYSYYSVNSVKSEIDELENRVLALEETVSDGTKNLDSLVSESYAVKEKHRKDMNSICVLSSGQICP